MRLPKLDYFLVGLVLMVLLLTLYAGVVGIGAGMLIATTVFGVGIREYLHETVLALSWTHILIGMFKGTVYGALVAFAGCVISVLCLGVAHILYKKRSFERSDTFAWGGRVAAVLTAVALTTALSALLQSHLAIPATEALSPVAFLIGALGNGWRSPSSGISISTSACACSGSSASRRAMAGSAVSSPIST